MQKSPAQQEQNEIAAHKALIFENGKKKKGGLGKGRETGLISPFVQRFITTQMFFYPE